MFTLNCKGRLLSVDKPLVMGIINITPDSFYPGSRFQDTTEILVQAGKMMREGADFLDIGAQSTRPGSQRISADEELERLMDPIQNILREFPDALISVDTYYSKVAREAISAGAAIVNDISAGTLDENMVSTVAALQVPYIVMHMKGEPGNMQDHAQYGNITLEVLDFFIQKVTALKKAGLNDLMIDPGFGFAKTIDQNFELLRNLAVLKMLELPILAGLSRKSAVYKTLKIPVEQALNGSTVLNSIALLNGANILRVHDVREAREAGVLIARYFSA